jgi:ligand-binding SRPBCC domain-containing protein
MGIHRIERTCILRTSLADAWSFFSDPKNLPRITPGDLGFEILSDLPGEMHPGMMIEYRVSPLFGLRMRWLTEITQVRAPFYFVDEQRVGPYRLWHHEHRFREIAPGRVEATDLVHYVPPFGPLGEVAHPFVIAPRLREIFDYRERVLAEIFGLD